MSTKMKIFSQIGILFLVFALLAGLISASPVSARPFPPKNIIVMIGDGMGFNNLLATGYYLYGQEPRHLDTGFPVVLGMSTYEVEKPADNCLPGYDPILAWSNFDYAKYPCATDSASAATAMATGVKTYNGYIGVDVNGVPQWNVMQAAETKGKSTGVVTSVSISHATPAGFVAHNISRNNYAAIANEMIYQSGTDVIMGTGNPGYDDSGYPATKDARYVGGLTTWDDLLAGTAGNDADGDGDFDPWMLIQTRQEFQAMASGGTPGRVIGVAQVYSTLQQSRAGEGKAEPYAVPFIPSVPTLKEMAQAALNVLDNDPDGFVLMIEGGAVDWAAHANQSGRLVEETTDFINTVEAVVEWVQNNSNWGETLLIITADHDTGYLTGPMDPANPVNIPVVNNGVGVLPGMQWNSGEHTNHLVPFYAKGNGAIFFKRAADLVDPVRGYYLDNTELAWTVFELLR